MRGVIQSAYLTMIVHFKEGAKQFSLAAARTAAAQPALQRGPQVALFAGHLIPGPDLGRLAHAFHDLPLFDLPDLALPGLRSLLRRLRPGSGFACDWRGAAVPPWSRRRPRVATRPSESSSNRNAPATGAASTRRTSTTSPSRCMAPLREPTSA